MPRRSGTTTVWSFASLAAIGDHMSPVLPKPWISTTAGPWPPTRTWIVASAFTTCELRKSAGKGVGAACADRAPSARLAARPAATRRKRRENVDETVADMPGSFSFSLPGLDSRRTNNACLIMVGSKLRIGWTVLEESPLSAPARRAWNIGQKGCETELSMRSSTCGFAVLHALGVGGKVPLPSDSPLACRTQKHY